MNMHACICAHLILMYGHWRDTANTKDTYKTMQSAAIDGLRLRTNVVYMYMYFACMITTQNQLHGPGTVIVRPPNRKWIRGGNDTTSSWITVQTVQPVLMLSYTVWQVVYAVRFSVALNGYATYTIITQNTANCRQTTITYGQDSSRRTHGRRRPCIKSHPHPSPAGISHSVW